MVSSTASNQDNTWFIKQNQYFTDTLVHSIKSVFFLEKYWFIKQNQYFHLGKRNATYNNKIHGLFYENSIV